VLRHAVGALLVRYTGARFDAPEATDVVVQTQTMQIEIAALMRALRTHDGLYPLLDSVRRALTGFRPAGCSPMHPMRETYTDYAEGVWQYTMEFAYQTLYAEAPRPRDIIEFQDGQYAEDPISWTDAPPSTDEVYVTPEDMGRW
jgi:hypothetical protein